MKRYKALLLDAFGTVVEINEKRTPYHKLFSSLLIGMQ